MIKRYLPIAFLFAFALGCFGGYVNTELLYRNDFNSKADVREWSKGAEKRFRPGAGVKGSGALFFHTRGTGTDTISLPLDPAKCRGKFIQVEAAVKARDLKRSNIHFLGPKVQLHVQAGDQESYPSATRVYGTYDWQKACFVTLIPENCDKLTLFLGIQGTSGEFWVDSVSIHLCEESDAETAPPAEPNRAAAAIPRGPGKGTKYRGVMIGYDLSPAAFETLAQWKANLIRYQMHAGHLKPQPDVSTPEKFLAWVDFEIARIDSLMPLLEKHGIKIIIDLHSSPMLKLEVSSDERDKVGYDVLEKVWRKLAAHFKGNPNVYGYDLLNEPFYNRLNPPESWQKTAEHLVETVRAIDPETPIIVEPFAAIYDFTGLKPIQAKNIIYSPHFYQPVPYTLQGLPGLSARWSYPGYINGAWWDKEQLRVELQSVIEFQRKYNVPIFVGEFSAAVWAKGAERYLADAIELFEEYGWDWTYHAFREANVWNVELEPVDPKNPVPEKVKPSADNPRKKVLLEALSKNR